MPEEVDINEFAVNLTIGHIECYKETFREEAKRFFEQLKDMRRSDIDLPDLIDPNKRITFIRGIAGIGKSVLVKQLTIKWVDGELFNEFKLCITFECSQLNYFINTEGSHLKRHELINEFIKWKFTFDIEDADDVLFIIDGLDELHDINENNSIIGKLLDLEKSMYPKSKVVITGRPHVESKLLQHGKNMGGMRRVEIRGLSDEEIEKYVSKFSSSDKETAKIRKAMEADEKILQILHLPQFLNSFCCVALLTKEHKVHNAAELYCLIFYLLLKQHAEKDGLCCKRIPQIFSEYSRELLALSKICHDLLNKNTIIFEGNIESQFGDIGEGKEFLLGLFVDVPDMRHEKKQFKHLTLMEFLSAVYVCTIEDPTEIVKDLLRKKLFQVLIFNCQLISGLLYDGIIKDLFTNAANLSEVNCDRLLCSILKLIPEYVEGANTGDVDESFQVSIDVIMCLMNKDISNKQRILSMINKISCKNVWYSTTSRKLIEMITILRSDFECSDIELKRAFKNVNFHEFVVTELNQLKYAKFLASVYQIGLESRGNHMETVKVADIHQEFVEVNKCVKCRRLDIVNCIFQDEEFDDVIAKSSKLEWLQIWGCKFNQKSFKNLCKWVVISSVEELQLENIQDIDAKWWTNVLLDAVLNAQKENNEDFILKKLDIHARTVIEVEVKNKVITLIMIQSYFNFILAWKAIVLEVIL